MRQSKLKWPQQFRRIVDALLNDDKPALAKHRQEQAIREKGTCEPYPFLWVIEGLKLDFNGFDWFDYAHHRRITASRFSVNPHCFNNNAS